MPLNENLISALLIFLIILFPGKLCLNKGDMLPSASVMHVVGFNGQVIDYFPLSSMIRLSLTERNFLQGEFMCCEAGSESFGSCH